MGSHTPVAKLQEVMHEAAPLPQPVWLVVRGVSTIHWLWRLNRKKELYENPDNWFGLMIGHVANAYVGNGFIRTSAHLLLIATKIQEHVNEVHLFNEEVQRLANAIDGYYLPTANHNWCVPTGPNYLTTPASETRRYYFYQRLAVRIERIYICTFRVLKSLFGLTMHTLEVYDSLYRTDEAMNEVVINGVNWMENFTNHKKNLLQGIRHTEKIINRLLTKWNTEIDAKAFITKLEQLFVVVETTQKAYQGVSRTAGKVLKRSAAEYATISLGLGPLVPRDWFGPVQHPRFIVETKA